MPPCGPGTVRWGGRRDKHEPGTQMGIWDGFLEQRHLTMQEEEG